MSDDPPDPSSQPWYRSGIKLRDLMDEVRLNTCAKLCTRVRCFENEVIAVNSLRQSRLTTQ
jgi:hypothetical protein